MNLFSLIHFVTDPQALIATFGLLGVVIIIFLETGCFFGFFFPGDSLLFTAGLLVSQGYLGHGLMGLFWLILVSFLAAAVGDSVGYAFGKKIGPAMFKRDDSIFFHRDHIVRAEHYYEKYGSRTIIMARFIPIVRTFAPIVAGIGRMKYRTFLAFNLIGGLAWVLLLIIMGYGFGSIIPNPDHYLLPVIGLIIIISILPALNELLKHRRESRKNGNMLS